jgi:hypothetical protein
MPKYTVCNPVKHDGKKYAVGASIDLTKAEAEALPNGTVEVPRADDAAARRASEKAQKAEADRKAQEEADAAQKAEADRLAAEKAEADRKAQEEADAAQKAEADRKAEEEADAAQKAEADRLAAEKGAAGSNGARGASKQG